MNDKQIQAIVEQVINNVKPGNVTLSMAKKLAEKVEKEADRIGVKAVVAIADKGGNTILAESMDDAYIASYDIAVNKAFTSVALKMSTKTLKDLAQPGQSLYGIQFTNNGRIVIFGGGVPLMHGECVVGGFGVSGGTEEEDTYLGDFAAHVFEEEIL